MQTEDNYKKSLKKQGKIGKSMISAIHSFFNDENSKYEQEQEQFFLSHMNKYTLKFFNRNLEKQYQKIEFKNHFAFIKKMMWIIWLVCGFAILKLLIRKETEWRGYAYFIAWPLSTLITYFFLKIKLNQFTLIHTINIFIVISLINWTLHDPDCKRVVHADTMSPFVRGFMFAQGAYQYITGTHFPSMAAMVLYIYFSFIFSSSSETYLSNIISLFPYSLLLIYKIYYIEKQKRITFLLQVQERNWSNIMHKVLPTSLMILRDNEKEERIELHKANNRAVKEFKVGGHQHFKNISERMYILQDQVGQPLTLNNQPDSNQQHLQKHKLTYKESWDNTLYAKLKKNAIILRPIFNPGQNQNAKKKQQEESLRVFRQLYQNSLEVNAATPLPQQQNEVKETFGNSQDQDQNQSEKNVKQNFGYENQVSQVAQSSLLLKDSDTLIENIKVIFKEEGVSDEKEQQILSIRINYFYLNDLYIAITIKDQSYKDKFKAQERETQFIQNFARQSINKTINFIKYPPVTPDLNKVQKFINCILINQLSNQLEFVKSIQSFPQTQSQKNVINKSSFDLQNLILSIFEILSPYAREKQIQLLLKNEDSINIINQDKYKLCQVLTSLIFNSLLYSKGKGSVAIEINKDQNDEKIIQFKIRNEQSQKEEISPRLNDSVEQPNFPPPFPPVIFSPISSELSNINVTNQTHESAFESKLSMNLKQNSQMELNTPYNQLKPTIQRFSQTSQYTQNFIEIEASENPNIQNKENLIDGKIKAPSFISSSSTSQNSQKFVQNVRFTKDSIFKETIKGDGAKLGQKISTKLIQIIGPSNTIRVESSNDQYSVTFKIYQDIGILTQILHNPRNSKKQFSLIQIPQSLPRSFSLINQKKNNTPNK
ncbi:transmembrane protein, putative (macronuclear) [Tetrahymena thermophila SB210]|uniref:Transmembrane protein, putative n=1 Tax=Tetrahymena thermophila (strain SB210) TaxID=312017 RepID=Q22SM0_TETTS|nr:transmembrane protein, putative [Tetrahymena thermophila SB210]EAR87752.2 transmembrane protein, putative [Tetrahymena thermophila SB210]|eukprot:XP_001007997.2 transmembrane protein, putative [Tetrahymena thermophila SB210]